MLGRRVHHFFIPAKSGINFTHLLRISMREQERVDQSAYINIRDTTGPLGRTFADWLARKSRSFLTPGVGNRLYNSPSMKNPTFEGRGETR